MFKFATRTALSTVEEIRNNFSNLNLLVDNKYFLIIIQKINLVNYKT